MPGFDELAEHLGRVTTFALAVAVLQRPIKDVEAAEVEKGERAHRPVEALLHGDVDVRRARVPTLQQAHRLFGCGEQDAVDDESPDLLLKEDWSPVDRSDEFHRGLDCRVGGFRAAYDLAELHHR